MKIDEKSQDKKIAEKSIDKKRSKLDSGVKVDEEITHEKEISKDDVIQEENEVDATSPNASNSKMPESDGEAKDSKKSSSKRTRVIKIPICLNCKTLCESYKKLQENTMKI